MDREQSSFSGQPSRWAEAEGVKPRRGKSSKKHALKGLPDDWCDRVWAAAIAENSKYLDALAIHVLSPVRPAELVPGQRDGRFVAGGQLRLEDNVLVIEVAPVKLHGANTAPGTPASVSRPTMTILSSFIWWRFAKKNDGTAVVSTDGTNPIRKAMAKLGRKALGDVVVVTGYLFRNQCLSDLRATVGAGTEVAAAAGHSKDRTQARYGRAEHGRRRVYFISATAKRKPTGGNVQRASHLKNLSASHDRLGPMG